ncbi:MAG: haloalkane dehalogenase [Acidimicrobiales bacterium]|jgi:haloalkane dehalogenase|nr:haloalkane dehalogenase [Acidimicrobiales bacterium]
MSIQTTDRGVPFLRTPDDRFSDLPDFPYTPNYVSVDGFRMAYIDEGPSDGAKPTILLLHGEPTWSYLYRRMIPALVEAGHRVIAPDLIGFGRSDKPTERSAYTYNGHVAWMHEFLDSLFERDPDIGPLAAFLQDWGGLIGLRVAAERPERFEYLCAGNTALPNGEAISPGFDFWLELSQTMDPMDCGVLVNSTVGSRELTQAEMNAYNAPFPDEAHLAGAREFPCLVAITPEHGGVAENLAAREVLGAWQKPVLLLWGKADQVLGDLDTDLRELIPGTADQPHQDFENAGHFIQDDVGAPLAEAMVNWLTDVT